MYDYMETVKADVREWIDENMPENTEERLLEDEVYDECWVDDSVTGNASGSYTFSRYEAKQHFFEDDNVQDYLRNMCDEGFTSMEEIGACVASDDWENWMYSSVVGVSVKQYMKYILNCLMIERSG